MTKLGYLIPTREQIMLGQHSTDYLLTRAKTARDLDFDSLWVGEYRKYERGLNLSPVKSLTENALAYAGS